MTRNKIYKIRYVKHGIWEIKAWPSRTHLRGFNSKVQAEMFLEALNPTNPITET